MTENAEPRLPRGAFGLLVGLAGLIGPVYALLGGFSRPTLVSLVVSLLTIGFALYASRRPGRLPRILLAWLLALAAPLHYGATGAVFQALGLRLADGELAGIDRALLGWLFPEGQLAILFDRSTWIGPLTLPGRALSEVLQVFYFSYYLWGALLFFLLLHRYGRGGSEKAWRVLKAWLVAWAGAYLLNFALYLLVPAMGPWWSFPPWFEHEIGGLFLTGPIRQLISENQITPDCFPSGHTALSWITALVALRVAPRYGRVATAAAILITLATLVLRYHYAIDVIAAPLLVLAGMVWGGWWGRRLRPTRG